MTNPMISELVAQGDKGFRELVAFDEIISELSESKSTVFFVRKMLFDDLMNFFGPGEQGDFNHALGELTRCLEEAKERFAKGERNVTVNFNVGSQQTQEMVTSFITNTLNRPTDRATVVGRALLIAAESSFEVLFGQVARAVYTKNPAALSRSDHAFTLEELSTFSSIDDAREYLISRKIETLLHESLEEWNKWLKRTLNTELDQILPDWPVTREIFIRRNMLVHTNGKVTHRYLDEIRRSGGDTAQLTLGDSLAPSIEYLQRSLQRLIALEVLLVFRVWSRLEKGDLNDAASWLSKKLQFVIENNMLDAACLMADSFDGSQCHRKIKLDIEISGWSAHKTRDGLSGIADEVSAWDVSGLDQKYVITKKLLLDDLNAAELDDAIHQGIFTRFDAFTNPLFAKIYPGRTESVSARELPEAIGTAEAVEVNDTP